MTKTILRGLLLTAAASSSCVSANEWGSHSFALQFLMDWSDQAEVASCSTNDGQDVFLFNDGQRYALVTVQRNNYDIALIDTASDPIEIEANGGIGRYIQIQEQFEKLKVYPRQVVRQTNYDSMLAANPATRCNF